MSTRGFAPQPTVLKMLHGNPGKRPLPEGEPTPEPVGLPPPPENLTEPVAVKEWNKLVEQFDKMKMLGMVDLGILESYCRYWAQWQDAIIKVDGKSVIMGPKGFPVVNPYIKVADTAFSKILPLMRELGLTPASRTRINIERGPQKDKTSEFLFGGKKRA